jgi:hypothetical protein
MKSAKKWAVFVAAALATIAFPTLAQVFKDGPVVGSVVQAKGELPIRDAAPGGFFQGFGKEIGKTDPGKKYLVLDQKDVLGLTGSQAWIKVQPIDGDGVGWAYAGSSARYSNFEATTK